MKRVSLLLLPLALAVFLVALFIGLPGKTALAAAIPDIRETVIKSPTNQVTETEDFFVGAPLDISVDFISDYCTSGAATDNIYTVWEMSYAHEISGTLMGLVLQPSTEWENDYGYESDPIGWSWTFGPCRSAQSYCQLGERDPEALYFTSPDSDDGNITGVLVYTWLRPEPLTESIHYTSVLSDLLGIENTDWVRKGDAGGFWPREGFTETQGIEFYMSARRREFTYNLDADCSTYTPGTPPFPFTISPLIYGVPDTCESCVGQDDLLSSGTANSTPTTVNTIISDTYFITSTTSLLISWDNSNWYPVGHAGETCGTNWEDGYASIYVTAQSSTLYLMSNSSSDYNVYDGACLYGTDGGIDSCDDYYTINYDTCRAGTIDSKANAGEALPAPLGIAWQDGYHYYFETQPPPYLTVSSPPALAGQGELSSNFDGLPPDWALAENFANCVISDTSYSRAFFEFEEGQEWGVRATDTNDNYTDNLGDMAYTICQADYSPPPPACESNYNLVDLFDQGTISANSQGGYYLRGFDPVLGSEMCMNADSWYALETQPGPWYDCNQAVCVQYTDIEISEDAGASWVDLDEWPGAMCAVPLTDDYLRVYFRTGQLPSGQTDACNYKVRVDDVNGEWNQNQLSVDYELWTVQAATVVTPPVTGDCSGWDLGALVIEDSVSSTLEQGEPMPSPESGYTLVANQWYALETDGLSWLSNATQVMYLGGLTPQGYFPEGIRDWYELADYPGAACVETVDTNYTRIYFQVSEENTGGLRYRAHDTYDTSYLNNTGDSFYNLYTAVYTDEPPPPCGNQYEFTRVGDGAIPSQLYNGVGSGTNGGILDSIEGGGTYRIVTAGGPWDTGDGSSSYDIDISPDGGLNWYSFSEYPGADCLDILGGGYYSLIFTAAAGSDYALRVSDGDESNNYPPNLGSMQYVLYSAQDATDPPPPGDLPPPGGNPVDPGAGCNVVCFHSSPPSWTGSGILDFQSHAQYIGGWLSYVAGYTGYVRCQFSRYIAWCPYHSDVVMGMDDLFINKEPYGTIYEFIDTFESVKAEIESYNWTGTRAESGGEVQTFESVMSGDSGAPVMEPPQNFIFAPQPTPTGGDVTITYLPWETGSIWSGDDFEWDHNVETYSTTCINAMADSLGPILSPGVCYATNALEASGLNTWFNWVVSGASLFALALYIKNKWIDPSFE